MVSYYVVIQEPGNVRQLSQAWWIALMERPPNDRPPVKQDAEASSVEAMSADDEICAAPLHPGRPAFSLRRVPAEQRKAALTGVFLWGVPPGTRGRATWQGSH